MQDMREHEYTPMIPTEELVQVKKLWKRAHKRRGWGMEMPAMDAAWATSLEQARTGAGLQLQFDVDDLNQENMTTVCFIIDRVFMGGFLKTTLQKLGQPLRMEVVEMVHEDWMTSVDDKCTIYVNKSKWYKDIHATNPMNFESAMCTSRLEALVHALAHELVHLLVLLIMPEVDKSSPAYLPEDRHGPIFKLLNKKLFGHLSHHSHQLFRPRGE